MRAWRAIYAVQLFRANCCGPTCVNTIPGNEIMNVDRRARICALNDQLRQHHRGGRIFLSRGLSALGREAVCLALNEIAAINQFDASNDPYGEHDFGSVVVTGRRLFWKIDYYDDSLLHAADPADPSCTRVMTIMLAEEY